MFASTTERVTLNTPPHVNEKIRRRIEDSIERHGALDPPGIDERLAALDREWDVERALETSFGAVVLLGMGLAVLGHRRWLALAAAAGGFMLQHAIHGWCPPVAILRRLNVRTQTEIDYERYALKALRGDFANVRAAEQPPRRSSGSEVLAAVMQ
jgi:hypothetical protein